MAEIPLRAGSRELRTVTTRLEVGRQLYNACLQEASQRAEHVRHDPRWATARALPTKTKAQRSRRTRAFRHVRAAFRFGDYALQHFAITTFRRSQWMCDHLQAHEVQKLGTRAYLAAHRLLLGQARRVRFKGRRQFHTLESKSNKTGIRWRGDHVEWHGLVLPARIDPKDPVIAHALNQPVKYVRIVRRRIRGTPHLCAGGRIVLIPAGVAKLSQTCHRCRIVQKKPLRQRVHQCACGIVAQRDLYSAFLARHTDAEGVLHAGQARRAWPGADPLLRAAWSQAVQPAMGRRVPSTFGTPPASRSQSGSLAEERIANAEAQDVHVLGEAAAVPLRTPGFSRGEGQLLE